MCRLPSGRWSGFPWREGSGWLVGRHAEALHQQILWQGRCYSLRTPSPCLFWALNKVWTMHQSQFKHSKLVETHIFSSSVSGSAESSLEIKRMQIFIIFLGFFWLYVVNFFIQIGRILKALIKNVLDARSTILPLPSRIDLNIKSMWSATEHYPAYASEFTVESETPIPLCCSAVKCPRPLTHECFVWYIIWTAVGQ